jgi:hypothetical protein
MKKIYHFWALSILALAIIFILPGCKSASDQAVENAIENATNTDAEVDASENKVKVNVNGASWETGDSVSLPANFPDDIHVTEGTLKVAIANDTAQGFTVSLETSKSVSAVKAEYLEEFPNDGWTITGSADIQSSSSVMATKGKRSATVAISPNEDKSKTIVSINTYTDTSPEKPE